MTTSLQLSFYSSKPLEDKELLLAVRGRVRGLVVLPGLSEAVLVKLEDVACGVGGGGPRGRGARVGGSGHGRAGRTEENGSGGEVSPLQWVRCRTKG